MTDNNPANTSNPGHNDEWPMTGFDASRCGVANTQDGVAPPLESEWELTLHEPIFTPPAIAGGLVFVGTMGGRLYAIDTNEGLRRWYVELGGEITPPVVSNDTVYIGCRTFEGPQKGYLYALDLATGEQRWQRRTHEEGRVPLSAPVVTDETLIMGYRSCKTQEGLLCAIDAMSGDQLWEHQTEWPIENAPAVSDGTVYCSNGDCYLEALSLDGETTEWRFKTHRGINAPPAVVNETVYVGSGGLSNDDVRLHAVDAATGEQEWSYELHHQSVSTVVSGETVYASDGRVLHAIDTTSGKCRWTYDAYPSALTAPSIVADSIYLGRNNGLHWSNGPVGLDVISAETGELETQLEMDGSLKSPMIANGTIYCGDDTGEMVALKSAE